MNLDHRLKLGPFIIYIILYIIFILLFVDYLWFMGFIFIIILYFQFSGHTGISNYLEKLRNRRDRI